MASCSCARSSTSSVQILTGTRWSNRVCITGIYHSISMRSVIGRHASPPNAAKGMGAADLHRTRPRYSGNACQGRGQVFQHGDSCLEAAWLCPPSGATGSASRAHSSLALNLLNWPVGVLMARYAGATIPVSNRRPVAYGVPSAAPEFPLFFLKPARSIQGRPKRTRPCPR